MSDSADVRSIAMPNPVETPEDYVRIHRDLDARVKRAVGKPSPRIQITPEAYASLKSGGRTSLKANNAAARIAFALALHEAFEGLRWRVGPIFWVTMVRREHAIPLSKAAAFDIIQVRRWVAEVMAGWDYFGMTDAGYFSNYLKGFDQEHRWISWHGHFACWGKSRAELTRLRDDTNLWTPAFLHGRDAMQFYEPASSRLPGLMLYAAKSPISEYRVFKPASADGVGDDPAAIHALEQRKRPLRPGDAVRTYNAMGDRALADLTVSGGNGVPLMSEVLVRAMASS